MLKALFKLDDKFNSIWLFIVASIYCIIHTLFKLETYNEQLNILFVVNILFITYKILLRVLVTPEKLNLTQILYLSFLAQIPIAILLIQRLLFEYSFLHISSVFYSVVSLIILIVYTVRSRGARTVK